MSPAFIKGIADRWHATRHVHGTIDPRRRNEPPARDPQQNRDPSAGRNTRVLHWMRRLRITSGPCPIACQANLITGSLLMARYRQS
jgi:hypothetical protein